MKIVDARFIKSVFNLNDLPKTQFPEIAFSGRSNVGKSSLINSLLNRKGLAKTSSTPGRTQSLNYIEVNKNVYFVDLPGYGYAKVPLAVKKKWEQLIEGYLVQSPYLLLMIQIVDARRDPREDEALFARWLVQQEVPFIVVLTKIDKLKRGQRAKSQQAWQKFLQVEKVYPFSAVTGEGKQKIFSAIDAVLAAKK